MTDPDPRARITAALRGLEATEPLSAGDLLVDLRNNELIDVEERLTHILGRVREEIDNCGLN